MEGLPDGVNQPVVPDVRLIKALEARIGMDLTEWYRNNENEAIRQSFQRGKAKGETRGETRGKAAGKAEAILKVLEVRGLRPLPHEEAQIRTCQNAAHLDTWLVRAVSAASLAEILAEPK